MTVLRNHDFYPDGVRITVEWEAMQVGTSIFIPCIDTEKAKKQVKQVFLEKKWQFLTKIRVENKCLGVRVWRTV